MYTGLRIKVIVKNEFRQIISEIECLKKILTVFSICIQKAKLLELINSNNSKLLSIFNF